MPKKIKKCILDWMGEDWDLELVDPDDDRMPDDSDSFVDSKKRKILCTIGDENTTLTRVFHELVHKITKWSDESLEETRTEYAAVALKQFLEKTGVDISAIIKPTKKGS